MLKERAMEQQEVFLESTDILRISSDNVVRIARILMTLDQNEFKRSPALNIPLLRGRLNAALYRCTSTPTPRRPDAQWIRECEQDLQCLVGLTQTVMAVLTPSARQRVTAMFSLSFTAQQPCSYHQFGTKGVSIRYKPKKKKGRMENGVLYTDHS
jgi:hypothetical protein